MKKTIFSKIKQTFSKPKFEDYDEEEAEDEYVELDTERAKEAGSKVLIRPFVLEDFSDIKPILDALREGSTVCLVNIKPLKDKDLVELKRAINKLKKTADAIDGDIAGFSEDYIVIAPSFAQIYRSKGTTEEIKNEDGGGEE